MRALGVDCAKLVGERMVADLGQRSREFHPGGTASNHNKVQRRAGLTGGGLAFGKFEGQQHAAADFKRVLNRLKAWRVRLPIIVTEISMARAGGDDQIVVRNFLIGSFDEAVFKIEAADLSHEHFNIFARGKNRTDRRGDFSRGEPGGCDLIQQRLKGMEVLTVNDGDLHWSVRQRLRGVEAAETGSNDNYTRTDFTIVAVHELISIRFSAMADGSRSSSEFLRADASALASLRNDDPRPEWARVLLPSVGGLLFVAVFAVLLFTPLSVRLLGDAGIGWHIRTGQQILDARAVPHVDSFSSIMSGKPWFAWEWLYDVLVGGLERWAGLNGVVWFNALVIAAVFAWTLRLLVRRGTNLLAALVLVLLAVSASTIHFLARPHVISWLFTVAWLWMLDSSLRSGGLKYEWRLWLLPLLMAVWVNVHGGFLVGLVLLGIYWLDAVAECFTTGEEKFEDFLGKQRAARRIRNLSAVGVLAIVATLMNPYGWKLHVHIYQYLSDRFLMSHIQEFQSPNFHGVAERCFALLLLIALVALAARVRKVRPADGLVVLFAVYSGLYATRDIPVSSLLLVLVLGPQMDGIAEGIAKITSHLRRLVFRGDRLHRTGPDVAPGFWQRMGAVEAATRGYILPVAMIIFTGWIAARGGRFGGKQLIDAHFDGQRFPEAAVSYLEGHGVRGPVLSPDGWGGYLIYRFTRERPELRVVVDDRHDLYGDEIFNSYLSMVQVEPGWDEFLKQHEVGCLLLPNGSALSNMVLETRQWKEIYADDTAVALVREQ